MNKKKGSGRGVGIYILFFIVLLVTISLLMGPGEEAPEATYTDVRKAIQEERATELIIGDTQILLTLEDESKMVYEVTNMDYFMEDLGDEITAQQDAGTLKVDYEPTHYSIWYSMLPYLVIIVIMGAFWFFMMNRQGGGGAGVVACPVRQPPTNDTKASNTAPMTASNVFVPLLILTRFRW